MAQEVHLIDTVSLPPDNLWDFSDPENGIFSSYPNYYEIYIATATGTDVINWTPQSTGVGVNACITSINSVREGFDFEKGQYSFDDIQVECLNLSGYWTDYIFNSTVKKAEIRIFYRKNSVRKPVFYGIINLDDYEYEDLEHPDNTARYSKYRKYKFNALSFLKSLEDIPIDSAFVSAIYAGTEGFIEADKAKILNGSYESGVDYEYTLGGQWSFLRFDVFVKKIFAMTGITIDDFNVICDMTFEQSNIGITGLTLDQLYLPIQQGFDSAVSSLTHTILDSNKELTEWSIFKYENAAQLLANFLKAFGLVWKINLVDSNNGAAGLTCEINLVSRSNADSTIILDSVISNSGKLSLNESISSAKISVMGLGDVSTGTGNGLEFSIPFVIMNCSDETHPPASNQFNPLTGEQQTDWSDYIRALYFLDGTDIRMVTDIKMGSVYYHSFAESPKRPLLDFGRAIADYYCGTSGVFSTLQETLDLEIASINAALASAPTDKRYNYLTSGNKFLWNGDYYLMINTEKDLFANKTKIKAIKL